MGQTTAIVGNVVLILCMTAGCAGKPGGRSLVTFAPLNGFRAAAQPSEGGDENPFTPTHNDSDETIKRATYDESGRISDKKSVEQSQGDSRLLAFDPETRALIEDELKEATPDEREELLNDLAGVDSGMARQVLKIRRMMTRSLEQIASEKAEFAQIDAHSSSHGGVGQAQVQPDAGGHSLTPGPTTQSPPAVKTVNAGPRANPQLAPAGAPQATAGSPNPSGSAQYPPHAPNPLQRPTSPTIDPNVSGHQAAPAFGHSANPPQPAQPIFNAQPVQIGQPVGTFNQAPAQPAFTPQQAVGATVATPGLATNSTVSPPAVLNSTGPLEPAPGPGQHPQQLPAQPSSVLSSAMGTLGSAYSAVVSNFPGRDAQQPATAPSEPTSSQLTSAYAPAGYNAVPSDFQRDLGHMIDAVAFEAAQTPMGSQREEQQQYIHKQVQLRMLYLMSGQQERALEAIPNIHPSDQEFWQQVFWSLANYFDADAMPDASDRATQTIAQLRTAVQRLQESARLEIRNVNFCHTINSYGDYERFQQDEFTPGQPVLVYAEVENFKSEPTSDGRFRTLLRSTIDIHRAGDGVLVQSTPFQATEDNCRNHRRDYFHSYKMTIPQQISLGPHVMKLTIEDQLSRKLTTYSLNFTVK